ncbi:ATP-dependent DNA helicase PIF1-like [Rhagoletis pomonella]|uniref:ATP-dependent DNA helicase PIF1-like n=1 Tax=Rhagoletis pomonella TaxID=28610 RepID=UPI001783CED0|nr:ATP-dependent DNA helicase PIF1-like [Rhagoletis pomonella]
MAMLFYPWRSAAADLIDADIERVCNDNKSIIEENKQKYDKFSDRELKNILENLNQQTAEEDVQVDVTPFLDEEFRALAIPEIGNDVDVFQIDEPQDPNLEEVSEYFGGIPLIVFGDLKQLSPVGDRWIFSPNQLDPYSGITGTPLWDLFRLFELTEIMRQREDQTFAVALNNMSEGNMTSDDIELIKAREPNFNEIPNDCIHLFCSNADVSLYNTARLAKIATEEFISTAKDSMKANSLSERSKTVILDAIKNFKISETQGMCYGLQLKTSAKYMFTVNINTEDGLGYNYGIYNHVFHDYDYSNLSP